MSTPPQITIPGPNVPAIDPRTGNWTKEWYPIIALIAKKLNGL